MKTFFCVAQAFTPGSQSRINLIAPFTGLSSALAVKASAERINELPEGRASPVNRAENATAPVPRRERLGYGKIISTH